MDEQKLKDIYYDAETGLGSVDKLYRAAKEFGFTRKHVQAFVKKQSLNQIFKPVGKRSYFPIWSSVDGSYFADIIFYPKAAKINAGFGTAMLLIECTTRKAYIEPMKNKTTKEVLRAFEAVSKGLKIANITTDMGSEWKSRAFKAVNTGLGAKHYMVQEGDHHAMGLLDRCVRTVKQLVARSLGPKCK